VTLQPIKRIARVSYGLGQPPAHSDDGVPIIRATNINRGRIEREGLIFASLDELPLDRAPLLHAGEILVVRSGAYTGDSAIVTREWAGASPGYDLRITPVGVHAPFLAWALLGDHAKQQIDVAKARAAQPHLNAEELAGIGIFVPDLAEQRQIADFLDAETARIDALIENKRRAIALLEERRVALTASCIGDPAWPRVKLTLVSRLGSGHTPSRDRPDWWEDATIPWITTGDVAQMRGDRMEFIETTKLSISELGLANSAAESHPEGTVVLSRTASVGFSAIMARPMATSQDFATWTCGPRLMPRFLLLCLRAMRTELLERLAMGSTHKTIYMPDIEAIRVPLPSMDEQERVVDDVWSRLRPIDAALDAVTQQIGLMFERRQALITAAVTGQLDAKAAA
jgi:type I restriction enzyme S subunit